MTDRELLELAAKAAGLNVRWNPTFCKGMGQWERDVRPVDPPFSEWLSWNPITDDGDAMRLAAQLKIDIEWQSTNPFPEDAVEAYRRNPEGEFFCAMYPEDDYRRAIVRAAAEIGKQK